MNCPNCLSIVENGICSLCEWNEAYEFAEYRKLIRQFHDSIRWVREHPDCITDADTEKKFFTMCDKLESEHQRLVKAGIPYNQLANMVGRVQLGTIEQMDEIDKWHRHYALLDAKVNGKKGVVQERAAF